MSDKQPGDYDFPPTTDVPDASLDERAEREAAGLAFGLDLSNASDVAKLNALGRKDDLHSFIHKSTKAILLLAIVLLSISAVVLFWHFLAPECWLFLSDDRIEKLRNFLFSGAIGAGLAQLARSQLLHEEDRKS